MAEHLTSFCQRRQGEIKYIRVSCIPIWSAAAVRQSSGSERRGSCPGLRGDEGFGGSGGLWPGFP